MTGSRYQMPKFLPRARVLAARAKASPRALAAASLASALAMPTAAWADCTLSGSTVTCDSTSASYSNSSPGLTVVTNSNAAVTAPLTIGNSSTLTNNGAITNSTVVYGVQFGDNATITNNGTITSTSATTGAGTINVGANSTVTNNGTLTAASGTPAVNFGANGTFINNTTSPAVVTGNIVFGTNTGTNVGKFYNYNTTYGITGSVIGTGNLYIYNNGILNGNIGQVAQALPNAVTIVNDTGGTFTGIINTGDQTNFTNNGTAYIYSGSSSGSAIGTLGLYSSLVTNNGALWVGTTTTPAQLTISGNFVQNSAGTLNMAIAPSGASANTPGTYYSQILTTGTAKLGGTLNLNVSAGFYPTGALYKVVDAAQGITGNFSSVTGNDLLFVSFNPLGVVTVSGSEQAYEVVAQHKSYTTVMQSYGASANQLQVTKGLDKLLTYANNNPGTDAASFLGGIDVLNIDEARHLLNQISPEGYLAYAQALNDQANTFMRHIDLRMNDQNSDHPEDGWWLKAAGQGTFNSVYGTERTRDRLFGFSAGYDLSGPRHVVGAAVHVSWDSLTYGNASLTGTNRDYAVAVYGAQKFGPLRLSGQVAYNFGHLKTTKTMSLGDTARTATGSSSENLLKVTGQVGLDLKVRKWLIEPFAGIDFNTGSINSFTETGANAADLTVGRIKADRTDILAGLSATKSTGVYRPYFKTTYRANLNGNDTTVSAYFNGDSTTAFTIAGLAKAKSEVDVNAGMNFVFDDAGALFVGYQGTYRANYMAHGINFGIRVEF